MAKAAHALTAVSGIDLESRCRQNKDDAGQGKAKRDKTEQSIASRLHDLTRRFTTLANPISTPTSTAASSLSPPATLCSTSTSLYRPPPPLSRASSFSPSAPLSQSGPSPGVFFLSRRAILYIPARGRQAAKKGSLSLQRVRHCTWLARGGLKLDGASV